LEAKVDELGAQSAATSADAAEAKKIAEETREASADPAMVDAAAKGVFVEKGDAPGSIKIPGTGISLGARGFAKLDVIQSFGDVGAGAIAEELFDVTQIPTRASDPISGDRNSIHARESRLTVFAQGDTETFGRIRGVIEGDFFGAGVGEGGELLTNSEDFRIRLAKVDFGRFTAGMDWTTYGDVSAYPENLDFLPPGAAPFIRQGVVRYTHPFGDGFTLAVAVENEEVSVLTSAGVDTTTSNDLPAFVARARWEQPFGHLQFAGVYRQLRSDETDDTTPGFGVGLSGRINAGEHLSILHPKDNAKFHIQYGDGIGRFVTDNGLGSFAAATDPNTLELVSVSTFGVTGSVQHWWTDSVRSTVNASYVDVGNPSFAPVDALDTTFRIEGNLVWSPVRKLDLGAELQYGRREDQDGADGDLIRTQFSAKYSFP
ncbi:MAG: DcaP family trimeric outer membrane transporter, partial [Pseudomonadota bacterium]